jgi:hypothetical protein
MRRGLAIAREQATVWPLPSFEAAPAEAEVSAGEITAGLQRLDDALAEAERTEQRWCEAEPLLQRDPADTAAAEHFAGRDRDRGVAKSAQLRTARCAVSGEDLSRGRLRRR